MQKHILKFLTPMIAFFLFSIPAAVQTAEAGENEVLIKGQLVTEKCIKEGRLSGCYLKESEDSPWVIFTGDKKLYKIVRNRAAQWKLDSGFGKQVVIKGILKGNKILVNDAAALEGSKKMSKSCL